MSTPDEVTGAPATIEEDRRALDQALAAIAADHPDVPVAELSEMLRERFERTRDAKVTIYRVVLAEREVRLQLRRR